MIRALRRVEDSIAGIALALMVLLPLSEVLARPLGLSGVPGGVSLTQHLTLWVGFLGAALAAREDRLLSFATGQFLPEGRVRSVGKIFVAVVAGAIAALLFVAGVQLVLFEHEGGGMVTSWIATWALQVVLPLAFGLIALRLAYHASPRWPGRLIATAGLVVGVWIGVKWELLDGGPVWPWLLLVVAATLAGAPIFAALGGVAALLFMAEGVPPVAVLVETYRLSVSPTLASIPLFTLAGFILAQGQASQRLVRLFRAWFGWIPGGTAVVCVLVCAFFTAPTGGSGVTILALGGLLIKALREEGFGDRFNLGLLTGSGSLGLLFPPALPLILFGIVSETPIDQLFLGGLLPGILLVGLMSGWAVREGYKSKASRTPFEWAEARRALWVAKWEVGLPIVAVVGIFGGFTTLVEAAALTAFYTLVVQVFVTRDVSLTRGLPRAFYDCLVLLGGVLLILGVAMGLTSWLVDAQVPTRALSWVQAHIDSPIVFLLMLNVFLLLVGCLMDIFSATVVVVPLIAPLGQAFGIDPVHLGIIFVANLELGYLTPPVGLNLFMSSYRFEKPILEIYRAALPPLLILGVGVLLITYVPWLTTGLLDLFGLR